MNNKRIIVIGGGGAGLIAAGEAAGLGADTILLERMSEPGRKLKITGKGRCNLTNIAPLKEFLNHYGKNGQFLRSAFNRFFSDDLVALLGEMGVEIITERGGRVFPFGEDAPAVVAALVAWVKAQGVIIRANTRVHKLLIDDGKIVAVSGDNFEQPADAVIIATGGVSYPATGSTGDGYRLAESVGHTIVPVRPSLVPVNTSGDTARRLQGLSLRNVKVKVRIDNKKRHEAFGEMLFTHFGLSGPILLSLSKHIVDALRSKQKVTVAIDLKPALAGC